MFIKKQENRIRIKNRFLLSILTFSRIPLIFVVKSQFLFQWKYVTKSCLDIILPTIDHLQYMVLWIEMRSEHVRKLLDPGPASPRSHVLCYRSGKTQTPICPQSDHSSLVWYHAVTNTKHSTTSLVLTLPMQYLGLVAKKVL